VEENVTKPSVASEEGNCKGRATLGLEGEDTDSNHSEDEAVLLSKNPARKSFLHDSILSRYRRHSVGELPSLSPQELGDQVQVMKEDIYSLIYTAKARSQAFWFAIFVFLVQISVIWLLIFDLIDQDSTTNFVRLPPGVPMMVNLAQGLGVLLIVFTVAVFGDLTTGMERLVDGYNEEILLNHPNAGCIKWFLSGSLQMFAGGSMTLVLFILLMQSTTVIGMCLNFGRSRRGEVYFSYLYSK
jgi:hypothetical protein